MTTRRLLGFDPATGLAQWWLEDGEGNWAQQASQQATPILDLNREAWRASRSSSSPSGAMNSASTTGTPITSRRSTPC